MNFKKQKKRKTKFIFYRTFFESIEKMPKENQLELYRAITHYALNGEDSNLKDSSGAVFNLVKAKIDENNKKLF
ncbi:putative uncharacterized protein [Clostridium sp. CAG:354]|nr:putative uncharacterized protein [Clostridium sp. CAG:354]HIT24024.1 hypothetical protein [Candidatus Faecimonas intestinavium]